MTTELPTFHEGLAKYSIYTVNIRDRGTMFAVRVGDNPRCGGDPLHATYEDAVADATRTRQLDEGNTAFYAGQMAEAEKQRAAEEKARLEREDLDGFDATMTPLQRGRALKTLMTRRNLIGRSPAIATLRDHVRALVRDGQLPNTREEDAIKPMGRMQHFRATQDQQDAHERRMKKAGTKTVYAVGGYVLGKVAHDYAQHLKGKQP